MAERVNYTKNNIINHRLKYLSEYVLQLYIKIHLCSSVTNNILGKIHKKLQIMLSIWLQGQVLKKKILCKIPRNTIYVLTCLKARVVPGNSSFCSAYLALGGFMGRLQSVLKCRLQ